MSEADLLELAKLQFQMLAETIGEIADIRGEQVILKMYSTHGKWTVGSAIMTQQEASHD